MVSSRPELLQRVMYRSVALQQPGSELMSRTPGAIKGHVDDQGLVSHFGPCQCLRIVLLLRPAEGGQCCHLEPWRHPGTGLCLGPCLGLGRSVAPVATLGLCSCLGSGQPPGSMLLAGALLISMAPGLSCCRQGPYLGPWSCCCWESVVMFMTHVSVWGI